MKNEVVLMKRAFEGPVSSSFDDEEGSSSAPYTDSSTPNSLRVFRGA